LLVFAGVVGAALTEQDYRGQKSAEAMADAQMLAASATAALAFEDAEEARRAIDALKANPDVDAAGIYRVDGSAFVRHAGSAAEPPDEFTGDQAKFWNRFAVGYAPVSEAGTLLGWVYLRLDMDAGVERWMRYLGVGLLLGMAAVLLAAIIVAQRSLAAAHTELERRAKNLSETNEQLNTEVAERKKAQQALAQAQKMEAIGQLTGGLAHDFNNLLAAISGGLRLLERSDDPERRAMLKTSLDEAVQRGSRLTRQLLSFARGQSLRASVIDPCARMTAITELLQRSLGEDVRVELSLPGDRWRVFVDPDQLELAILNLAVNARDAMPAGGILRFSCENIVRKAPESGDFLRLSIIDTGAGMAQETIDRAFEPFFTTKDVGKGTGLGLAQVYAFARQSGGRAWIESEQGRGTAVNIELPRTQAQEGVETQAGQAARLAAPLQPPPKGEGRRILMVEDDDAVASIGCELLKSHGYVCRRAASAREGLQALEEESFDLLFSDIVMPGGMSGTDLARVVRTRWPRLAVLLTTGYAGKAEMAPGEFRVLYKPWRPDDLLRAIYSEIEASRTGQPTVAANEWGVQQ
jgi:signal transduction histidine kinase/ActR/RegA family two-component response regulator